MSKRQYTLLLVLVVLSGFLGGAMSSRLLLGEPAFAQKPPKVQPVVAAEQFLLVDKGGKTRAELGLVVNNPMLFLYDRNGKARAWFTVDAEGNASIMFVDREDKAVWKAP